MLQEKKTALVVYRILLFATKWKKKQIKITLYFLKIKKNTRSNFYTVFKRDLDGFG